MDEYLSKDIIAVTKYANSIKLKPKKNNKNNIENVLTKHNIGITDMSKLKKSLIFEILEFSKLSDIKKWKMIKNKRLFKTILNFENKMKKVEMFCNLKITNVPEENKIIKKYNSLPINIKNHILLNTTYFSKINNLIISADINRKNFEKIDYNYRYVKFASFNDLFDVFSKNNWTELNKLTLPYIIFKQDINLKVLYDLELQSRIYKQNILLNTKIPNLDNLTFLSLDIEELKYPNCFFKPNKNLSELVITKTNAHKFNDNKFVKLDNFFPNLKVLRASYDILLSKSFRTFFNDNNMTIDVLELNQELEAEWDISHLVDIFEFTSLLGLKELYLHDLQITNKEFAKIIDKISTYSTHLVKLVFNEVPLDYKDICYISEHSKFDKIKYLGFIKCGLKTKIVPALLNNKSWVSLEYLNISFNNVGIVIVDGLYTNSNWKIKEVINKTKER